MIYGLCTQGEILSEFLLIRSQIATTKVKTESGEQRLGCTTGLIDMCFYVYVSMCALLLVYLV